MNIALKKRTAETVRIYFERANKPEIKSVLPQKAQTVEEALADFEQTQCPDATSYGETIYADGCYVGDIWCYCIDPNEEPNCMLSFCIFEIERWSQGIATAAVGQFLPHIRERYGVKTVGAFSFSHNRASIRVLEKNGFVFVEEFEEEGILSVYMQYDFSAVK